MIAENKAEFFEQLERELEKLGIEDTAELILDLEDHFAEGERRGLTEAEVCRELGSIAEIARSCLDLKSSAINSMVARDVTRKKAVSLTKPGRDVPADPSLAKPREESLRSYTPEHIAEEIVPGAPPRSEPVSSANVGVSGGLGSQGFGESQGGVGSGSSISGNVNSSTGSVGAQGLGGSPNGNVNPSSGTVGSQGLGGSPNGNVNSSASDVGAQGAGGSQSQSSGTFERIGKTVDAACDKAGKALNGALEKAGNAIDKAGTTVNDAIKRANVFSPSDSYRKNVNSDKHGGDLPPQFTKVKTEGGGKFIDTSGLQPNPNPGRIIGEIVMDVLLWLWLVPVVFSIVIAAFAGGLALIGIGITSIAGWWDFAKYGIQTRVLFALGFFASASAAFCLASALTKTAISLVSYIARRHIRAVYDI